MISSPTLSRSLEPPANASVLALRRAIQTIEAGGMIEAAEMLPFGIPAIDHVLGGGLATGALHEIAAARESEIVAATGFALAVVKTRVVLWIAEDMALAESGAPYGPGLDGLGLPPELCVTVAASRAGDVLWAMEEALRCRAVGAVISEIRADASFTLTRRLSLAVRRGALAFILRTAPSEERSAALTRWIVGSAPAAPSAHGVGPPRLRVRLVRNRRGRLGSWTLEWNRVEQRFDLAPAVREPVVATALDRPRQGRVAA